MPLSSKPPVKMEGRAEKYRPRTVKMPDSLWARFTEAALAEGESNISTFVRCCAVTELERRTLDRAFGAYRGRPGTTDVRRGHPGGRTMG